MICLISVVICSYELIVFSFSFFLFLSIYLYFVYDFYNIIIIAQKTLNFKEYKTSLHVFVTGSYHFSSHNLLQQLHWLPIQHPIHFIIANITFHTLQPAYYYTQLCIFVIPVVLSGCNTNPICLHVVWCPQFQLIQSEILFLRTSWV